MEANCAGFAPRIRRSALNRKTHRASYQRVAFARVPTGRETCAWCLMLASRGFAYYSAETARHGGHKGCDCVIIPGVQGSTVIEGYDPAALWRKYNECDKVDRAEGLTRDEARRAHKLISDGMSAEEAVEEVAPGRDIKVPTDLEAEKARADDEYGAYKKKAAAKRRRDEAMRAATRERQSGALNDANDPDMSRRIEHAERYYEEVRKRNRSAETSSVAVGSGLNRETVEKAYLHMFVSEYDLAGGRKRFDPDYEQAQSWQRLRAGTPQPHDITMLWHEAHEYGLMQAGTPYAEAHDKTNELYNYGIELRDYLRKRDGGA